MANINSLGIDFSHGADYESSTVSADGEFRKYTKDETSYDWTVSGGRSKSNATDLSGNTVVDNTYSLFGGLGLQTPSQVTFGVDYSYAYTPEEALVNYGPSLSLGYTYIFAGDSTTAETESEVETPEFSPKIGLKLTAGQSVFEEKFGSETRRQGGLRPGTGVNSIAQKAVGLALSVKPWQWVRVKLSGNTYSYTKDVNEFIQYLDAQPRRASGLGNSVSNLAKSDATVEVDLYFGDSWELDLSMKTAKVASDNSTSKTTRLELFKEFLEHWRVGIGTQRSDTSIASATTNEGLLNLAYYF